MEGGVLDREWYYGVVAHRRPYNDIRSSSTPDTVFGKKVPSLSEVGIIMLASAMTYELPWGHSLDLARPGLA